MAPPPWTLGTGDQSMAIFRMMPRLPVGAERAHPCPGIFGVVRFVSGRPAQIHVILVTNTGAPSFDLTLVEGGVPIS
jgi:hypothetical protein